MRVPRAADLLDAWDAGAHASGAQRALLLAQLVREEPVEELAAMPLGWIAAQLLRLRAVLAGPTLVCLVDCPQCGTIVESEIDTADLLVDVREPGAEPGLHHVRADDVEVEFRLPTTRDLLALHGEAPEAARSLARRVIAHATQQGHLLSAENVPVSVHAPIERAILDADPLAWIELAIACPGCGLAWTEPLHLAEFVWTEMSGVAEGLIHEVARLAFAFGWPEHDILTMSDHRRRQYLELLSS